MCVGNQCLSTYPLTRGHTIVIINMAAADQEPHVSAVRPRSFQDESYLDGFLGTVSDLQKAGVLQDVVLEVEGRRFPCHRLVLSAASPYFRAMFTGGMAESRQKTVVLQGLDASIFGEILSYIYSGTLRVSMDTVQPLYQAADLLQLDYVRDTCKSCMAMNVERSTCVDLQLYKFADVFSVDNVLKRCLELIHRNFVEVASSEEFCSLSVNQLTEIISHDELGVTEEITVWEAVVRWVQHSKKERLHHLPSILPHIRFDLLTSDDTAAILEHPLVGEDPGICKVIRNVLQKGNPILKARHGVTMEMALLYKIEHSSNEILFMNPREGKYISCSYKGEPFSGYSATTVTSDNNIYILETKKESDEEEQVSLFKYNHVKNVWELTGLSSASREPGTHIKYLFEVDQILYYMRDYYTPSRKVRLRKYNQHTNHWQECSQLQLEESTEHGDCAALSCGPHLYFLTSTEVYRYDPTEDRWSRRTAPGIIDQVHSAVAMGTEIFCTDLYFDSTMVYDTESDCWQKLQGRELNLPELDYMDVDPSLFAMENQLHIFLRYTSDFEEDKYRVNVYDRSADSWRDLKATLPNESYIPRACYCPVARISLPYLKNT